LKIIEEGLASPEELDTIVKTSFGFRLGAYGPCEIIDQAGLDVYSAIFDYFYKKFQRDQFKKPKLLTDLVEKNHYGLKNGKGFYEYEGDAQTKMRQQRDKRFYARLNLFKNEYGVE
jgi:3-hydroxybutyryl-CoA dehydrogenase